MSAPATVTGGCHCGNLSLAFETSRALAELPVRSCACAFCTAHGARTTTDPNGRARITVRDSDRLSRYRFSMGITEFLVCRDCGVYVAAVMTEGDAAYATLNVNVFSGDKPGLQTASSVSYDAETEAERRARRRANWTPTVVVTGDGT